MREDADSVRYDVGDVGLMVTLIRSVRARPTPKRHSINTTQQTFTLDEINTVLHISMRIVMTRDAHSVRYDAR